MLYAITVRLSKNPEHNPHAKVTGICPVADGLCTDVTGEHHTFLVISEESAENVHTALAVAVRDSYRNTFHVTRVERVEVPR